MTSQVRTTKMSIRTRAAAPVPSTFSEETRSFDLTWATDAPCSMEVYDPDKGWIVADEVLSMDAGSIRGERMTAGLPLLDNHQRWTGQMGQYGKVRDNRVENGQAVGRAFMSSRDELRGLLQDVKDGIADTFSVGYRVYAYEITRREGARDVWKAVDWEPLEVSFAPVQADVNAKARAEKSEDERSCEVVVVGETEVPTEPTNVAEEERSMAEPTDKKPELTREQTRKLMKRASELGLTTDCVEAILAAGDERSYDQLTDDVMEAFGKQRALKEAKAKEDGKKVPDPERQTPSPQARSGVDGVESDQAEKDGAGIINYVEHRAFGAPLDQNGQRFVGMNMFDLCRKVLTDQGRSTVGDRFEVVREALRPVRPVSRSSSGIDRHRDVGGLHTTSDFPDLLGDGLLRRRLVAAYNSAPDNFSAFVSTTTFNDPRTQKFIRVGGFAQLAEVKEGAEYKRKTFGEEAEDLAISKYGGIIGLSLEAILRDDLSAFTRIPTQLGRAAKKTESAIVYAVLTANDPLDSDSKALFHADHGNIGSANAPDMTGITDARTLMRKQKDVALTGATDRLGITPSVLAIPYKYELGLAQLVGPDQGRQVPTDAADIVPGYIRDTQYVVSDVLDANSTQVWYAFASPNDVECIVVARLEGNQPFDIERRTGWEVDGVEWKIRHWFGAGAIDYRGAYRNAGV